MEVMKPFVVARLCRSAVAVHRFIKDNLVLHAAASVAHARARVAISGAEKAEINASTVVIDALSPALSTTVSVAISEQMLQISKGKIKRRLCLGNISCVGPAGHYFFWVCTQEEMSRKVTLQVFGTNAPARTKQPAEYITDVQSVEMVKESTDGDWLAAIVMNTEGTHFLAPTWLNRDGLGDPLATLREGDIIRVGSTRDSRWSPDVRVLERLRVRKFRNDTREQVPVWYKLYDPGVTYTLDDEITVLRIDTALDVTSVTRPYAGQTSGAGDAISLTKRHTVIAYNRDEARVYPLYRVAHRPEQTRSWIHFELGPDVRSVDAVRLKAYSVEQPVAPSHLRDEPFAEHELHDPSCIVLSVKGATGPVRNPEPHVNGAFAVLHAGTHAVDGARRHYERAEHGAIAHMKLSQALGVGGRLQLALIDLAGHSVHGAVVQLWLEVDTTHT